MWYAFAWDPAKHPRDPKTGRFLKGGSTSSGTAPVTPVKPPVKPAKTVKPTKVKTTPDREKKVAKSKAEAKKSKVKQPPLVNPPDHYPVSVKTLQIDRNLNSVKSEYNKLSQELEQLKTEIHSTFNAAKYQELRAKFKIKFHERQQHSRAMIARYISVPKQARGDIKKQVKINGVHAQGDETNPDNTFKFFDLMVNKRWHSPVTLNFDTSVARANYDNLGNVKLHPIEDDVAVHLHEMAHHLEKRNPWLLSRSITFRNHRTKGETTQNLPGYDPSEVFLLDKWKEKGGSGYEGKVYKQGIGFSEYATEILSCGIQRLYEDPLGFHSEDPDYFKFTVDSLHGY